MTNNLVEHLDYPIIHNIIVAERSCEDCPTSNWKQDGPQLPKQQKLILRGDEVALSGYSGQFKCSPSVIPEDGECNSPERITDISASKLVYLKALLWKFSYIHR
jgi:hypothetical protein